MSPTNRFNIIPELSVTGDILSFRACPLQYRYYNRGRLPASKPVQVWFGEFIHAFLEDAFRDYKENHRPFPWDWEKDIRPLEIAVARQLQAAGLFAPPNLFCSQSERSRRKGQCPDTKHPHKLQASARAEKAVNELGKWLFPLIQESEVKLRGCRKFPQEVWRGNYFSVTGIVDVIASGRLKEFSENPIAIEIEKVCGKLPQDGEIIVDYKGMRRPATKSQEWGDHEMQVCTYAWLRGLRTGNPERVRCGILFYINELAPSEDDLRKLESETKEGSTDVPMELTGRHRKGQELPSEFRMRRCVRVIDISSNLSKALEELDSIAAEIERRAKRENSGNKIPEVWKPRFREETCVACDFKGVCPDDQVKSLRDG